MAFKRCLIVSGYQRDPMPFPFSPLRVSDAPLARDASAPGSIQHQGAKTALGNGSGLLMLQEVNAVAGRGELLQFV